MTIKARDEFLEDIDLVVKERVGFNIGRGEHGMMKRYLVKWEGQEIECIPEDVVFHDWQTWPMKIIMNRFITGRPNPIRLPIIPLNYEQSVRYKAGCTFHFRVK